MVSLARCGRCGAELSPEESVRGLCPRCLLGIALSVPPGKTSPPRGRVDEPREAPGERVGPFVLLEFLGEGGMGVVYLAEQTEPIQRRVALKLIKLGMDTREVIARFEGERQALALMSHPHIASVHDAGITREGRPYFVMAYVPGVPITAYCDAQRMKLVDRLGLFLQTCSAIQHAHEKGIIHRDIKPSNVLVSEVDGMPSVTVIDFGVAKATQRHLLERSLLTRDGVLVGTPEYMSPEQVASGGRDVDTRTDVYALGLLLYEILAGAPPFDPGERGRAEVDEIRKRIMSEEPPRPSARLWALPEGGVESARNRRTDPASLRRALRGDLDWIVMKALEKDRSRRYASAHGLAVDLEHHLRHEPVIAGPPGTAYRIRKFVRRHRIGVVFSSSLLALFVAFASAMGLQARRVVRERDRANREAEASRQVSQFLVGLFEVSNPSEARGNTIPAREILDRGAEKIDRELKKQPEVQARLMSTMGVAYEKLGLFTQAEPLLEQALETRQTLLGDEHPDTIQSLMELGELQAAQGKLPEAESSFQKALDRSRRALGEEHASTLGATSDLAVIYQFEGRHADAEKLYREALEKKKRILGAEDPDTLETINNIASLLFTQGHAQEALPFARQALEGRRRVLGADHPETLDSLINLGVILWNMGDLQEAEAMAREAVDLGRRIRPDHPSTLVSINNVGRILRQAGRLEEAEPFFRESVDALRRVLGDHHANTLTAMGNLGNLYTSMQRYQEARAILIPAVQAAREALPPGHAVLGFTLMQHGRLLTATARFQDAEKSLLEAEGILMVAVGGEHAFTQKSWESLAELYEAWGKPEKAGPWRSKLPTTGTSSTPGPQRPG